MWGGLHSSWYPLKFIYQSETYGQNETIGFQWESLQKAKHKTKAKNRKFSTYNSLVSNVGLRNGLINHSNTLETQAVL